MMKPKHKRLLWLSAAILCMTIGLSIILLTFQDNLVFFYSPKDLNEKAEKPTGIFRLGGMVKEGTIQKQDGNPPTLHFTVTDYAEDVKVTYSGIAPPMFREKQGVVAEGKLEGNIFKANNLLTKHDEKYMPPEVVRAVKEKGEWKQ